MAMLEEIPGPRDVSRLQLPLVGRVERDGHAVWQVVGVVLAGYEDCLHGNSWRNTNTANARYFTFLATNGYELSDVGTARGQADRRRLRRLTGAGG